MLAPPSGVGAPSLGNPGSATEEEPLIGDLVDVKLIGITTSSKIHPISKKIQGSEVKRQTFRQPLTSD